MKLIIMTGLLCLSLIGNILFAQDRNHKNHEKMNKQSQTKGVDSFEKSIDLGIDKLPPNFKGNSFKKVYKLLTDKKDKFTKGEYETTEDYNKRYSPMDLSSIYAFKLESELSGVKIGDYNADNKSLPVFIKNFFGIVDIVYVGGKESPNFLINYEINRMGSYIGSNAFGAKKEISKRTRTYYALAVDNHDAIKPDWKNWYDDLDLTLNVAELEVQDAKNLKANLAVLVVCKAYDESMLTHYDTRRGEPKIDYPYDDIINGYWINVKVLELWLYNYKSGKVYLKEKFADANSDKAR